MINSMKEPCCPYCGSKISHLKIYPYGTKNLFCPRCKFLIYDFEIEMVENHKPYGLG